MALKPFKYDRRPRPSSSLQSLTTQFSLSLSLQPIPPSPPTSMIMADNPSSHSRTNTSFLLCNYTLLGAATSCIFLTLSLRLIPSPCGLLLILLHILTIIGAGSGLVAVSSSGLWHGAHMVATVLTAILQGSAAVLVLTRTAEFLFGGLRSYVRTEDGVVILRMVGAVGAAIFCLEWLVLALAFALRYYDYVEGDEAAARSAKVRGEEEMKDWQYPYHV